MTKIKELIKHRKISKIISPLNFIYDRTRFKTDTDYLIGWLDNIGIKALNISKDNNVVNILIVNICGNEDTNVMYCISLLMTSGVVVDETYLLQLKDESTKYNAIPVLLTIDDLGNSTGMMAKMLGIQIIIGHQIDGINNLIMDNNLPIVDDRYTLLTHRIVHYARAKLAKFNW